MNKVKKIQMSSVQQSILKKLETLREENEKSYWNLIDKLQGIERNKFQQSQILGPFGNARENTSNVLSSPDVRILYEMESFPTSLSIG